MWWFPTRRTPCSPARDSGRSTSRSGGCATGPRSSPRPSSRSGAMPRAQHPARPRRSPPPTRSSWRRPIPLSRSARSSASPACARPSWPPGAASSGSPPSSAARSCGAWPTAACRCSASRSAPRGSAGTTARAARAGCSTAGSWRPPTGPTSPVSTSARCRCSCPTRRRPPPSPAPRWTPPVSEEGPLEGPPPPHPSQTRGAPREGATPAEAAPSGFSVHPVTGLPEFAPGDDLAAALAGAAPWLADGDVVVVTSKVVSKVEGRLVRVEPGQDRETARQRAIEHETVRVVARRGPLAIVETRQGWVVAAAGIDASNVAQDALVLLPEDADASARGLRQRLAELLGVDVAVGVSETFGRAWREGLPDVAVGAAGIDALEDHRGAVDRHGNTLETTQVAIVDELASAADLVKGKLAGVPVAVVRGLPVRRPAADDPGTRPLVRLGAGDLFPYGSRDLLASRRPGEDLVPR